MTDSSDRIVGLYERRAAQWAQDRDKTLFERKWLDAFVAGVPAGGIVLDLGCGSGEPIAVHLAAGGFRVTGIDSSPSLAAMFIRNVPGHRAVVADMRGLRLDARFDAVLAWDSFFHLRHDDQRAMFPIFRAHARPGAMLMFTSGPEHGTAIGRYMGEDLYHASLSADEYRGLLAAHGFAVVAHQANDLDCGGHTVWLARAT
jgi:SAM-dependent methyltransferase